MSTSTDDITALLKTSGKDRNEALGKVYAAVYQELKQIARKQLQGSWSVDTISTTALVNEAYLKLIRPQQLEVKDKAHFFALAATAMRQIIINYAEQKQAQKRGGDWFQVTYNETLMQSHRNAEELIAVSEALEEVRALDDKLAQIIELRFFAGMTETEISEVFGVNERTVRRNWKKAKALLVRVLRQPA
ncbi:sigma-70 family RNA polymerase sigma factor [Exilibacterium tricleocarpae]|uniref:Sigma-70 family RNA polymerase sigma factor n=1 Tax=Exilibacterium tricleocarpae TaxID=2591008 RepID=A0A545SMV5_9GAMM|nr:ECF-type sigma factor [Exilibacterium tricleocarpae]TQV66299.1 sigma-70 family RNA polymerase sigma factor [Exilibacterium tricleocarpae]